jgi:hypothetical protein
MERDPAPKSEKFPFGFIGGDGELDGEWANKPTGDLEKWANLRVNVYPHWSEFLIKQALEDKNSQFTSYFHK